MASKINVVGIVAWVLVVVLALAAGALGFLGQKQSGRAAGMGDALLQVATTAGVADLTPEALKDPAALPDILQKAQGAIQAVQQELATTKEALTLVYSELNQGQQKKILKNEQVRAILVKYGVVAEN